MRGNNQCPGCHHWVEAPASLEPVAGWCGFSTTPRPIERGQLVDKHPRRQCNLLNVGNPAGGDGKGNATAWAVAELRLVELDVHQFRGVTLAQVCHVCVGSGLEPGSRWHIDRGSPRYKHPCEACEGRGYHGERKLEGAHGQACTA